MRPLQSTRRLAVRWLSPLIVIGLALSPVLVLVPTAEAQVTGGTAAADRPDYVLGMAATANATFDYDPPANQIDDLAFVEWRWGNGTAMAPGRWVLNLAKANRLISFEDAFTPPGAGLGLQAVFRMNTSTGDATPVFAAAVFNVHPPADYVIVTGMALQTAPPAPFNGSFVTATASMTDLPGWILGNPARIGSVRFTWRDAAGAVLRTAFVPAAGGLATDSWLANRAATGFTVNATYLGNDTVSNVTSFDVAGGTLTATDVAAGQSIFWPVDPRPWRVCGNLTIAAGGTLTIEGGVLVLFCPGSALVVSGTLRVGAATGPPVQFVAEGGAARPGDWRGIVIQASSGTSSILRNFRVENASDGVAVEGASPTISDAVLRNGTGAGVRLVDSFAVLLRLDVAGFRWGLLATRSRPFVLGLDASAVTEGIAVLDGGGSYEDVRVAAGGFGLNLTRSQTTFTRLSASATEVAVVADGGTGTFRASSLVGGATGLRARTRTILELHESTVTGGSQAAVDAVDVTLTFYNSSLSAAATDLVLFATTLTLVNSSFFEGERQSFGSTILVQVFLHVRSENETGAAVPGATVFLSGGYESWTRMTAADGWLRWGVVTDHRILPNGDRQVFSPRLNVSKPDYATLDPTRALNASASQEQTFRLRRVVPPPPAPIVASFTFSGTYLTVDFLDGSTPSQDAVLVEWDWNFGDGYTSSSRNPRHVYEVGGTYAVRLRVFDDNNWSARADQNVTVLSATPAYDTDSDGMPNTWEVAYGLDPNNRTDAGGDPDGDGYMNIEEFEAGTNPRDGQDHPVTPPGPAGGGPDLALPVLGGALVLLLGVVVSDVLVVPAVRRRRREAFLRKVPLRIGTAYLIMGRDPAPAFGLFLRISAGRRGLIVSRAPPASLQRRYPLGKTPVFWLGRIPGGWRTSATSYLPTNLGGILDGATKHMEVGKAGIVLLDGLEYLLTENEFPKVVRFLQKLIESTSQHKGVVLMPFDLDTVSAQKEAYLTKNIEVL